MFSVLIILPTNYQPNVQSCTTCKGNHPMTNLNTKPVVATSNPEIYENHTYHMSRATPFTYNYASLDDYILANWKTTTQAQIAKDTNELITRVQYRIQVLKNAGVIEVKHLYLTKASRTKKEYLQSWNKTNELYKELMALDDTALAG